MKYRIADGRLEVKYGSAIELRGTPDPEREAHRLEELKRRATGTGKSAQRARRELRDRGLTT
jgi:hypothetical protein